MNVLKVPLLPIFVGGAVGGLSRGRGEGKDKTVADWVGVSTCRKISSKEMVPLYNRHFTGTLILSSLVLEKTLDIMKFTNYLSQSPTLHQTLDLVL